MKQHTLSLHFLAKTNNQQKLVKCIDKRSKVEKNPQIKVLIVPTFLKEL